ncbi:MAG: TIGR00730 family Rossman fold protein [Candidatus Rokubacteria bacterium]|nr:TIGR00730 family Rossman fold protein [Candidatus Rokubacteria bacterium]
MANERKYQLQAEEANRQLDALLEGLQVPRETWPYYSQMLTTILKMFEDSADVGDLKIANSALKELRYAFKVFASYRDVPKVTVFGSARTPAEHPFSTQARDFGGRMVEAGWMVVTGAGSGVMGGAQAGAGREKSFGLNIRLPFEQEANPWIADDPKLITFKYFFTRKLFLLKESAAVCYLPGGFGTCDEAFEVLTLIQTGKTRLIPVILLDVPGGSFWKTWEGFVRGQMVAQELISPEDAHLFRVVETVDQAAREILDFYRVFHSQRVVGGHLVLRLRWPLSPEALRDLQREFEDILKGPAEQVLGPLPAEGDEFPDLPRLVLPFNRTSYGRLRQLIDFVNRR